MRRLHTLPIPGLRPRPPPPASLRHRSPPRLTIDRPRLTIGRASCRWTETAKTKALLALPRTCVPLDERLRTFREKKAARRQRQKEEEAREAEARREAEEGR